MHATLSQPQAKRWTRDEYYRLGAEGFFHGQRVQLLEGEIIQMPPQGHAHAKSLTFVTRWLHEILGPEHLIRIQMPLNVPGESDPEPDAAVVLGALEASNDHPQTALWVIEVSDSSVALDRKKAALYAAAGVQEYWIVDLGGRQLEVRRKPVPGEGRYGTTSTHGSADRVSPLARPEVGVRVADLLQ
jgi:Uma2 family endonuclease